MIDFVDVKNVLFLDIETVSKTASYLDLDETFRELWMIKCKGLHKGTDPLTEEAAALLYEERAGIFAEFGKIICISVGVVIENPETKQLQVRLKSYAGDDEAALLSGFCDLINKRYNNPDKFFFCGHNIKEFDIPYICRRLMVNRLPLPNMLNLQNKKPWEAKYLLDTLDLWKFGDYKHYTSLKLLAALFGFPSPKDDIDGSEVGRVYWEEQDVPRISRYCEKDVLATIQLLMAFKRMEAIPPEQVEHV